MVSERTINVEKGIRNLKNFNFQSANYINMYITGVRKPRINL